MIKWRDVIRIHPAAEVFPRLDAQEFETMAADVKARGLLVPVKVMRESNKMVLLDGITRLDVLEASGVELIENGELRWTYHNDEMDEDFILFELVCPRDESEAVALIRSLNEHRRHLTVESREETRAKIAALLKTNPARSDRSIAAEAGKSQPYVSKVRHELEKAGDVITVITSTDAKGRAQPRRRSKKQKESPTPGTGAAPAESTGHGASSDDPAVSAERMKVVHPAAEEQAETTSPAEHLLAATTAEPEISATYFIQGLIKLTAATQTDHSIDSFKGLLAKRGDLNLSRIINLLVTVAGLPEVKQMRGRIGTLEAENAELRARIARLEAAPAEAVSKAVH